MTDEWEFRRNRNLIGTVELAAWLDERRAHELVRRQARSGQFLRSEGELAADGHRRLTGKAVSGDWIARHRMLWAYDLLDYFLARARGPSAPIPMDGQWPRVDGACLALGFHWGPGFWAIMQMGRQKIAWRGVIAVDVNAEPSSALEAIHFDRHRWMQDHGGGLFVPSATARPVIEWLDTGGTVITMVDIICRDNAPALDVTALGRPMRWNATMPKYAVKNRIPVVFFGVHVDAAGRRRLVTEGPFTPETLESFAEVAVSFFERLIALESAFWGNWAGSASFLRK